MVQRSVLRPDQLDVNGNYSFAGLTVDGYSGGNLNDGYLVGLIMKDGYVGGVNTLSIYAHDGRINQTGTGQVSFNGNVDAKNGLDVTGANLTVALDAIITGNAVITGDLTVNGLTTTINTQQMLVTDPITNINESASEGSSKWTGFSARDADGYNRIGWLFDGYWGISPAFSSASDAVPTRAIAYMGEGDAYGDLSSTASGNSGAGAIGFAPFDGVTSTNVQGAIEQIQTQIISGDSQTTNNSYTINYDAVAGTDEDTCLIMKGGDGTALVEGYMCLITDSVSGDRFQYQIYNNGARVDTDLHLGPSGVISDVDAILTFNAGTGSLTRSAAIRLNGTSDRLEYTASAHQFTGNITAVNNLSVQGNTTIGNASSDQVNVISTFISNLVPVDDAYYVGLTSNRWIDGYFSFFTPTNYTPIGNGNSLEGHLKGIDSALASVALTPPRGVYFITLGEGTSDSLDTTRATDQGQTISTASPMTDAQFRDNIFVYHNGQLLYNDSSSALNKGAVINDVARKTGELKTLFFGADLRKGSIIQIVDMR